MLLLLKFEIRLTMFDMKNALELSKLVIHFIIIMHTVIWEKKFEINHY